MNQPIRPTRSGEKEQLLEFIETEKELRREFAYLEKKLKGLIPAIKKHNRDFLAFYKKMYGETSVIVIGKDNEPEKCIVVKRPEPREATMEVFMPVSVDFSEEPIIKKDEEKNQPSSSSSSNTT